MSSRLGLGNIPGSTQSSTSDKSARVVSFFYDVDDSLISTLLSLKFAPGDTYTCIQNQFSSGVRNEFLVNRDMSGTYVRSVVIF